MTIKVLSKRLLLIFLVCSTGIFSLASQTDEIEVWAITWSPNDNILAIGQSDGLVKIIDAQTNTLVNTLDIAGPDAGIIRLAWSPDGTRIATTFANGINIFDANFVLDFDIVHHSTYILDMEFHEQLALSGEQNGTTIVSNLVTGELISTIPDPSNGIIALNWHPSGDFVVTTNWDGERLC